MAYNSGEKFTLAALSRLRELKKEYIKLGVESNGGIEYKGGGSQQGVGAKHIMYEILNL